MSQETSAVVFLMFLLGLLVLWAAVRLVRTSFTVSQCVVFVFCLLIARLLWRSSVPKQLLMKGRQGAVVVSNHRSTADSLLIQVYMSRLFHWMVIRETFKQRIGGWV
ncbi:MAG: hypothetical protein IH991_05055, partial [Planctomycetes bacterium]|nr:hypothetical protein [Planctomycetota bacterium]